MSKANSLYAAFDVYPAPKGAATHIHHMAKTLFEHTGKGLLYVLGGENLPAYQDEDHCQIIRFSKPEANVLARAIAYGEQLQHLLQDSGNDLRLAHFRDPWSAFPILNYREQNKSRFKTVFEVNALPSIEMPYAYPHIAPATLDKIHQQEMLCLQHSDLIITPSNVTAQYIAAKGIPESKIQVLTNGADLPDTQAKHPQAPEKYIMYFGAIQKWQGIEELLRAFSMLKDLDELKLVLAIAKHNRTAKEYRKLAKKLEIDERIVWLSGLEKNELNQWLQHAEFTVSPLIDCERNVDQGCCPLKILESMAAGVPVIASDLPVVTQLMQDNVHGCLVRPNRALDLAQKIRALHQEPEARKRMGLQARSHIEEHYQWPSICKQLTNLYTLLEEKPDNPIAI